jgi:hypothetical protein
MLSRGTAQAGPLVSMVIAAVAAFHAPCQRGRHHMEDRGHGDNRVSPVEAADSFRYTRGMLLSSGR